MFTSCTSTLNGFADDSSFGSAWYRERLILSGYDWRLMTEASTKWLIQSLLQGGEFSDRFMSEKGIIKKLSQMLLEKFVKTWQFDDSWTLNGDTPLESPVRIGEKNHISLWDISISGNICKFCWFFSSIDAELFGLASVLRQRRLKSKCLSLTSDPVSFVSTGNEFVFLLFVLWKTRNWHLALKVHKYPSTHKSTSPNWLEMFPI